MGIRRKHSATDGILNSNCYHTFKDNHFTSFCLLTHFEVNKIRATAVLNKNTLRAEIFAEQIVVSPKLASFAELIFPIWQFV